MKGGASPPKGRRGHAANRGEEQGESYHERGDAFTTEKDTSGVFGKKERWSGGKAKGEPWRKGDSGKVKGRKTSTFPPGKEGEPSLRGKKQDGKKVR